jgi:hypothetical protein
MTSLRRGVECIQLARQDIRGIERYKIEDIVKAERANGV